MNLTGQNYIGNSPSGKGDKTFQTYNPASLAINATTFYEATSEEIDAAVQLAQSVFNDYAATTREQRATFLVAIAEEIEALGEVLLETYVAESGLPMGRAQGERGRTMGQLRAFANLLQEGSWVEAVIDTAQPDRQPLPKVDIRKMQEPIVPVVVFGASNFPLAFSTAGGDTASALAAGCPVIVKGHPMHAGTSEWVTKAILKAAERTGMPNGVFSHMNSSGIEVGTQLVQHPLVKGVGFTGSIAGGTALYRLAAERPEPIPVYAEMGSINPVVVLPSALVEKGNEWAKTYAGSITLGSGQFCTNPGLIIGLASAEMEDFKQTLAGAISEIAPSPMLHPNILKGYEANKHKVSGQNGVAVLAQVNTATGTQANPMVASVTGAEFIANPKLHTEVFGPFSLVVECAHMAELNTVIQHLEGQLTGTILASEAELSSRADVVSNLGKKVGRLIFNGVPTGVEVCPAMQHGGPFPASSDSRTTSVGTDAVKRWARPVAYQNWPQRLLPNALKDENPLGISRIVNGEHTKAAI
jgi:NADP-dependent aldehyde dehydrogenase